jgi:FtsP/CotA-like multicopper oxidase with cupredoxin domain
MFAVLALLPALGAGTPDTGHVRTTDLAPVHRTAMPNDNRSSGGRLARGVLTLRLQAVDAAWYPEGPGGPALPIQAFAEEGKAPRVPGPMIRVPAGTEIRATVRNSLAKPLLMRGLTERRAQGGDSVDIPPGEVRQFSFRAEAPGTYFYWGRTQGDRTGLGMFEDGPLEGAFVVDPAGRPPAADRVLLIGLWADSVTTPPGVEGRATIVVNGLSWPHTERLTYTVGDSVRLRVINASVAPHPMHLHGFYYHVLSRGTYARDTLYAPGQERTVVTELMRAATTMSLAWVPTRPGNWLFHCHLVHHISSALRLGEVHHAPGQRVDHALEGMAGLATGIHVLPRGSASLAPPAAPHRFLRLYADARPNRFGTDPGFGFVLQEGPTPPAPDSIRIPGSTIVLTRGEPVQITVVNRTPQMVSVHWHGIELESYYDGVGDWSGTPGHIAPPIEPGDSFVVRMTPDRAGTFIYHTHVEEGQQLNSGLYGPLIIVPPGGTIDSTTDRIFLLGRGGKSEDAPPLLNGRVVPEPLDLAAGTTYRLRFINITANDFERIRILADTVPQQWRAFAKDGAELPPGQATAGRAVQIFGPGETYDFEYAPRVAGDLTMEATMYGRDKAPVVVRTAVRVR